MRRAWEYLKQSDYHEVKFWFGLSLLFIGLWLGVSLAMACIVVGAAVAFESLTTSYLAGWINSRK